MLLQYTLAIHHHAPVFVDAQGNLWVSASIGRWLYALSSQWERIVYVAYGTDEKRPNQDVCLPKGTVVYCGLGCLQENKSGWVRTWMDRMRRYVSVWRRVRSASSQWDILLIRGPTPEQGIVYGASRADHHFLLLVGAAYRRWNRRVMLSLRHAAAHVHSLFRHWQTIYLTRRMHVCVNSRRLCGDYHLHMGEQCVYVPTASHRRSDVSEMVDPWQDTGDVRLLYVGRVSWQKGLRELLVAFSRIVQRYPHATLTIAGDAGDGDACAVYHDQARHLGISGAIRWLEHVPYGESLFHLYQTHHAVVLPSYHEGVPHVLWESFLARIPVIATRVGGIADVCRDGVNAYLIEPRSSEAIDAAVERLLADPSGRETIRDRAFALACEHTVDHAAATLTHVLKEVLHG